MQRPGFYRGGVEMIEGNRIAGGVGVQSALIVSLDGSELAVRVTKRRRRERWMPDGARTGERATGEREERQGNERELQRESSSRAIRSSILSRIHRAAPCREPVLLAGA